MGTGFHGSRADSSDERRIDLTAVYALSDAPVSSRGLTICCIQLQLGGPEEF